MIFVKSQHEKSGHRASTKKIFEASVWYNKKLLSLTSLLVLINTSGLQFP